MVRQALFVSQKKAIGEISNKIDIANLFFARPADFSGGKIPN